MISNAIGVAVLYSHLLNPALNYCNHHRNVMGHQGNIAILATRTFRWFLIDKHPYWKTNKPTNKQTLLGNSVLVLQYSVFQKALQSCGVRCRIRPYTCNRTKQQINVAHRKVRTSSFLWHEGSCKAAEATQPDNGLVTCRDNARTFYGVLHRSLINSGSFLRLGKSSGSGDFYNICMVSNLQDTARPHTGVLASLFGKDDNSEVFLLVLAGT